MQLTVDKIAESVARHYSEQFNHPIYCRYDDETSKFDIIGNQIPSINRELYPNGWSMVDHVEWIDALNIAIRSN